MDGESGALREVTEPGAMGELALRAGWPSMMRGYLHEQARYDNASATVGT
jgi:acetyl-CoA synthetase